MRRTVRSVAVVLLAMLGVVSLAIMSAFAATLAYGAVALIVPGTGTPNANIVAGYRQNARDYYLGTTPCNSEADCPAATNLIGIDYPASFFPLAFIPNWCVPGRCNKWDDSVGEGVAKLDMTLQQELATTSDPIVVFGYSQGAGVVSNELRNLSGLTAEQKSQLSVVLIGDIDNPDGGLFTRLGFLGQVPFFDVTTGLATPVDSGISLTVINFEYDGVGDFPRYGGNLLADLNAIAGFAYIHGTYLEPNANSQNMGLPNGYTPTELLDQQNCATHPANCRYDYYPAGSPNAGQIRNTYILIPSNTLPIVMPFLDLAAATGTTAIVKPVVDLVSPTLRVLIDLGYDRTVDPGVTAQLSILPFNPSTFNPVKVTLDLVAAAIQGVHDAVGDLSVPPTVAPATTQKPAVVAQRATSLSADATEVQGLESTSQPTKDQALKTLSTKPDISDEVSGKASKTTPGATEPTPTATAVTTSPDTTTAPKPASKHTAKDGVTTNESKKDDGDTHHQDSVATNKHKHREGAPDSPTKDTGDAKKDAA